MRKKKFAKDPLLYIQQPGIQNTEAPMQHHYATPKQQNIKEIPASQYSESGRRKPAYYRELAQLQEQQQTQNTDGTSAEEKTGEPKEPANEDTDDIWENEEDTKDLKNMTLEEKVNYFAFSPKYVPKIKCKVHTQERTYRGVITDYQEGTVFVRTGKSLKSLPIPLEQITDIKMLGF